MIQTREMDRVVMTVGPLICRPEGQWCSALLPRGGGPAAACGEGSDLLLHLVQGQSCCFEEWRTRCCPLWT